MGLIQSSQQKHTPHKYGAHNLDDNSIPPSLPDNLVPTGKTQFFPSYDDELWLFERRWEPPPDHIIKATLIIIHGTVDHSGVYDKLATTLASSGIAVFAFDMRGWGLSDGDSLFFNDVDTYVADVDAFYRRIHLEPRYAKVTSRFLLGKSLGGTISAYTVNTHPNHFTGLLGLSGAYHLDPDLAPGRVTSMILGILNRIVPKMKLKILFDPKLIVSDADALQKWRDDPLCSKEKIPISYAVELPRCCRELSERIVYELNSPMLMMIGTSDRVVTLRGHELMVEKSLNEDTTLKTYAGGYHNLLAEPKIKALVIDDIREWILKRA